LCAFYPAPVRELLGCQGFVKKLEVVSMTTKVLSAELARERAWRVYCLMNPSAQRQIKLKAQLDSYLATLQTIDSNSLTVDGLKYLKSLETLGAEKSGARRYGFANR